MHMPETLTRTRTRATAYAAGLRALADFLDQHPNLPEPRYLERLNVWHPDTPVEDGAIVAAAEDAGLPVTVTTSGRPDTITVRFGDLVAQGLVSSDRRAGEDPASEDIDDCYGCEGQAVLDERGLCSRCAHEVDNDPWHIVGGIPREVTDPGPYCRDQAEHVARMHNDNQRYADRGVFWHAERIASAVTA